MTDQFLLSRTGLHTTLIAILISVLSLAIGTAQASSTAQPVEMQSRIASVE